MDRRVFLNAIVAAGIAPAFADNTMTDWTATYAAAMPVRTWGDTSGDCVCSAWAYCIELCGILQGLTPVRVSELDLYYRAREAEGFLGTNKVGCLTGGAATLSLAGICREDLWPYTLTQGPGGTNDYNAMISAINTAPNAAAVADRPNQKVVTYSPFVWTSLADFTAQAQAALADRHPISVFWPPDHQVCAMGWGGNPGAEYFIGFDPRSTNAQTYQLPFQTVFEQGVYFDGDPNCIILESVAFSGSSGGKVTTSTSVSTATFVVTGNRPTGTVSIVATYSGDANNLPSTSAPLVLPVSGASPDGTTVPPAASITDSGGGIWSLGVAAQYGSKVLLNGASAAGGQGDVISWKAGAIKVHNTLGEWWAWTGVSWTRTTAP